MEKKIMELCDEIKQRAKDECMVFCVDSLKAALNKGVSRIHVHNSIEMAYIQDKASEFRDSEHAIGDYETSVCTLADLIVEKKLAINPPEQKKKESSAPKPKKALLEEDSLLDENTEAFKELFKKYVPLVKQPSALEENRSDKEPVLVVPLPTGKYAKQKAPEGTIKMDKGKLRHDLLDSEVRSEILLLQSNFIEFCTDPEVWDEESFQYDVTTYMTFRMWIPACVLVMQAKKVTIDEIVACYTLGAEKYSDYSWQHIEDPGRYLASAYRHMKDGTNSEDGELRHWVHFCWNMTVLRWFEKKGISPKKR